ncbi:hypothetical protein [Rhodopila sp.]|uniref:hypothetical protein n=1 Tax=Rhodopila sp. TaxID=2480087 RepID=UPI003D131166
MAAALRHAADLSKHRQRTSIMVAIPHFVAVVFSRLLHRKTSMSKTDRVAIALRAWQRFSIDPKLPNLPPPAIMQEAYAPMMTQRFLRRFAARQRQPTK